VAKLFCVDIVSPAGLIHSSEAASLVAPAEFGYLGVLADHAPLIARLSKGKITLKDASGQEKIFPCPGGFMEVLKNRVTVIAKP
jgi:F-type H+-transporting ATPase subunit epsilon